jgi:inosine-uridine nucleoside N-ribohydrolase
MRRKAWVGGRGAAAAQALLMWLPLIVSACSPEPAIEPVPLIFDTDMGNDVDDALALGLVHALQERGECHLLGVTLTHGNRWAGSFVDLVGTFYGHGAIPIGVAARPKTRFAGAYLRKTSQLEHPDGSLVHPRDVNPDTELPEAVSLLRALLAQQADGAVVVVQVGFSTNLAGLLDSEPDARSPLSGRALVARKVRLLSVMGGAFEARLSEHNVKTDRRAAARLFEAWPTPIVVSGFEVGSSILFPASIVEGNLASDAPHPIADAYRAFARMPYDRPTWDLTAVLYAVRPDRGYFDLSPSGSVRVDGAGRTSLTPRPEGTHRYLKVTPAQRARVLEAFIELLSQPPGTHARMGTPASPARKR